MEVSKPSKILIELFKYAVNSVQPYNLIRNEVAIKGRSLTVGTRNYTLKKPAHVIGFGKAVLGMAIALEETLGTQLQRGIVSIPNGSRDLYSNSNQFKVPKYSKIEYLEGAMNNLPDENSMYAALQIKNFVQNLEEDDTIIVLISGGGSALLPLPKGKITLSEKLDLVKMLGNCGADIFEMNCVRKELSELKGGGLAEICYPARVISLILSDVIGDLLDIIASGPTSVNEDGTEKAIDVLNKYSLYDTLAPSIKEVLNDNLSFESKNIGALNGKFVHVDNFIVGNNEIAAKAALHKSKEMGFQSVILSTRISGNVENISRAYVRIAKTFANFHDNRKTKALLIDNLLNLKSEFNLFDEENLLKEIENFDRNKNICIILAGEPTVAVTGDGLGGRNQQLALSFSVGLSKLEKPAFSGEVWFLSCGTDGIDGPTDAAGAVGYSELVHDCVQENLEPESFLKNNDCYNFYRKFCDGKYLVKVGHTGTNVMDIHAILIMKK